MANVNNLRFEVDGIPYIISTGQYLSLSPEGAAEGWGAAGDIATVMEINTNKLGSTYVFLEKEEEHENWEDGCCLELDTKTLVKWFNVELAGPMEINCHYLFRKQNLKGMKCRVLALLDRRDVIVELEKDVGGNSADGIGKRGHCIPIKKEFLTVSPEKP